MNNIHPTAIVSKNASIGDNITVAPYAIIEDDTEIGNNCEIGPHAVLYNGARIGNKVKIKQAVSVAHVPQDLKFGGEDSVFIIGDNTVIHEHVTLHRGTKETGKSQVGKNCLLMAYCHIPHDCSIGDNCIIANTVQLAGHVHIEDWVIIGGIASVHQFVTIGQHAMVGANTYITQDVPPYVIIAGTAAKYSGLNAVGLRRRGFSNEDIGTLKEAYNYLYDKSLNISQAKVKIAAEYGDNEHVKNVLNFIEKSERGISGK
ncbi:MAG: acyl-[acyl-carrier-protein]--UDP-N-acetylglucosamine O-acyltransferase [Ignavibacteriae bacterium]|nr:MAG: acyl-[acyl-carrier-protein]--UDP-N-acetylglucosamine O-acyltransferase [Ignavibacteriota bacterium]